MTEPAPEYPILVEEFSAQELRDMGTNTGLDQGGELFYKPLFLMDEAFMEAIERTLDALKKDYRYRDEP